jgi:Uma2 family endonuclease
VRLDLIIRYHVNRAPGAAPGEVRRKARWYLDAGCPLLWVIDPQRRAVTVYRPRGAARHLPATGELDGEEVLVGFRLPLSEVWRAAGVAEGAGR